MAKMKKAAKKKRTAYSKISKPAPPDNKRICRKIK